MTKKLTISLAARLVRRYLKLKDDSFAGVMVTVKGDLLIIDNLNYINAIDVVSKILPAEKFEQVSPSTLKLKEETTTVTESDYQKWIAKQQAEYKKLLLCGDTGTMKDDENPAFIFSMTWDCLLVKIVKGEISAQFLAARELANRGLDKNGNWVGFAKAEAIHFS